MTLKRRLCKQLEDIGIGRGLKVLIALSGGGDSVALLCLVSECATSLGISINSARVSHGLRSVDEEGIESGFCRELSRSLNIPYSDLVLAPDEVRLLAKKYGCGIEQAARSLRMRALERHRIQINADYILFGHTADDQLETLLMRILSASGPEGLQGISLKKGRRCRPLLKMSRWELRNWLDTNKIQWVEDQTNQEPQFRRNRIRNELIPLLSDIFPGWASALLTLSEKSEVVAGALESLYSSYLHCDRTQLKLSWNIADWNRAPQYLKAKAVWDAIDTLITAEIPDRRIPWSAVNDACHRIEKDGIWNGYGLTMRQEGRRIVAFVKVASNFFGRVVLERSDIIRGKRFSFGSCLLEFGTESNNNERIYCIGADQWPISLTVATGAEDPVIELWGRGRRITEKLSRQLRDDTDKEIIYIQVREV